MRCLIVLAALALASPSWSAAQQIVGAGTMHLSRAKCQWGMLDEISQLTDSIYLPIAQQMVEEGLMLAWGLLEHDYGDGWNIVWYTIASDRQAMFSAREELTTRVEEQFPDLVFLQWFGERCYEHEDAIYSVGPHTRGTIR